MGDVTFMAGIKVTLEERNNLEVSALYRGKREGLREIYSDVASIRQETSVQLNAAKPQVKIQDARVRKLYVPIIQMDLEQSRSNLFFRHGIIFVHV